MMKFFSKFVAAMLLFSGSAVAETNIMFIVDASGSMKETVGNETRMDAAKAVLGQTLSQMPQDANLGMLVYGHRTPKECKDIEVVSPLGNSNASDLQQTVSGLTAKGETPIADALLRAAAEFSTKGEGITNKIILVTDGLEECGGDPCAAAQAIRNAGVNIAVDIVGFTLGAEEAKAVQCVADTTGGKVYTAANAEALTTALQEAAVPLETVVFENDFTTGELKPEWKTIHENEDAYIVDEEGLLLVSKYRARKDDLFTVNSFVLDRALPKKDFTLTVELNYDIQGGDIISGFMLGDKPDDHIFSYFNHTWEHSHIPGNVRAFAGTSKVKGDDRTSESSNVFPQFSEKSAFGSKPFDFVLQFRREGRKISTYYKVVGRDKDWKPGGGEITELRLKQKPLSFIFGEFRSRAGESTLTVKSIKLEVPADQFEAAKANFTPLDYALPVPETAPAPAQ